MKEPNVSTVAEHYAAILKELGADLDAEGMRETPMRAAKALVDMTEGSRIDTAALTKQFKSECNDAVCHDMVIVEGIHQVGLCEHHVLPILMSVTIGYVPDKKILGLSKLARIAGYFCRRLQNQERTAHLSAFVVRFLSHFQLETSLAADRRYLGSVAKVAVTAVENEWLVRQLRQTQRLAPGQRVVLR
jgi:GTP cyclohydrolase I